MVQLAQAVVDGLDWGVIGVSAFLVAVSVLGACMAWRLTSSPSSSSSTSRPVAKEFNRLWRVRSFTEMFAAAYAISHLLRLQLLWGPSGIIKPGGYFPTTFCRVYIAATYGVFEPAFLLLALFACMYSIQSRDSTSSPNFSIVLFSAGFSLPSCAAQLVAALFTRIFEINYDGTRILGRLFKTYDTQPPDPGYCQDASDPGNCAFCVFPLLSTFISAAFCAVYLAALWVVTQRIIRTVINKALARRVRTLQLLTTGWIVASLACRGCTVLFQPFELGFEALRYAHMLCVVALVLTLEYFLVLKPVWDTYEADRVLRELSGHASTLPLPLLPPSQELRTLGLERGSKQGEGTGSEGSRV